jgi:predicted transglutaminase-like cysteine proteinase
MSFTINDILAGNNTPSRIPLSTAPGYFATVDKWNEWEEGLQTPVPHDSPIWQVIKDAQEMDDELTILRHVTQKVNDLVIYKHEEGDRWQSPGETLTSGRGDCEDYAILKMWVLTRLGYEPKDLDIWIVHVRGTQGNHAVLLVKNQFVLDNVNRMVVEKAVLRPYYEDISLIGPSGFMYLSGDK